MEDNVHLGANTCIYIYHMYRLQLSKVIYYYITSLRAPMCQTAHLHQLPCAHPRLR